LKFKSPVKIYDSRARKALKIFIKDNKDLKAKKLDDYAEYCEVWDKYYKTKKKDIEDAFIKLPDYYQYGKYGNCNEEKFKELISLIEKENKNKNEWFKERIFDVYLWNLSEEIPYLFHKLCFENKKNLLFENK